MDQLEITGIQVYAYHGCLDEERTIGGDYVVDVILYADFSKAAETDHLSETIDYAGITRIVHEEMQIPSKLIEHVAKRIGERIKAQFKEIEGGTVRVTKLNPPVDGNVREVSFLFSLG